MDFIIRFIGIVLIVTGKTTPHVDANTAFLPKWRPALTFCGGDIHDIPKHQAFIRVASNAVSSTKNWTGKKCSTVSPGSTQNCTVFFIEKTSAITIEPGYTPSGPSTPGTTFGKLPRLGAADPTIELESDPYKASSAWLELPGGKIETMKFGNGMIASEVQVKAPGGTASLPITIQAIPRGGGKTRTIVVNAGTEISIGLLPPGHAGMDFNAVNPSPGNHTHFFLVNTLLPPGHQFCDPPDLDPLCSNQGCCP
jgi:hypothetical protein